MVVRKWTCGCNYSARCNGLPFACWQTSHAKKWFKKAAAQRAHKEKIRCPNCGKLGVEATGTEVEGLGTSTHLVLRCKGDGCDFDQTAPRSIWQTLKSSIRTAVLVVVVGVGVVALALGFGVVDWLKEHARNLLKSDGGSGDSPLIQDGGRRASPSPTSDPSSR
jgi:hypothetical protein